jgi:Tfp pilus assembly protein PilN
MEPRGEEALMALAFGLVLLAAAAMFLAGMYILNNISA